MLSANSCVEGCTFPHGRALAGSLVARRAQNRMKESRYDRLTTSSWMVMALTASLNEGQERPVKSSTLDT